MEWRLLESEEGRKELRLASKAEKAKSMSSGRYCGKKSNKEKNVPLMGKRDNGVKRKVTHGCCAHGRTKSRSAARNKESQ